MRNKPMYNCTGICMYSRQKRRREDWSILELGYALWK